MSILTCTLSITLSKENKTVALYAEDFETVHKTLCDIHSLARATMEQNVKVEEGEAVIGNFEPLFKAFVTSPSSSEEVDEKLERKMDYYSKVCEELGLSSTWCIYEVEDFSERHPFEGAREMVHKNYWTGKRLVKPIVGSTWAALYVAADALIHNIGPADHRFIEGFDPIKGSDHQLELATGS